MLHMDELNPRLKNVDTHLLGGLQSALESADSAALFQSALRPVLVLAGRNPHSFLHYFRVRRHHSKPFLRWLELSAIYLYI